MFDLAQPVSPASPHLPVQPPFRMETDRVRLADALDTALANLGSAAHRPLPAYNDHATDAILTSAWLRRHAEDAALWTPARLTPLIAATEGWTFGVA